MSRKLGCCSRPLINFNLTSFLTVLKYQYMEYVAMQNLFLALLILPGLLALNFWMALKKMAEEKF